MEIANVQYVRDQATPISPYVQTESRRLQNVAAWRVTDVQRDLMCGRGHGHGHRVGQTALDAAVDVPANNAFDLAVVRNNIRECIAPFQQAHGAMWPMWVWNGG